ncbi:MAG: protein-L-isoaspartate O-methyltransferase family protein, partial [Hyphomicrobiales bacterium]
ADVGLNTGSPGLHAHWSDAVMPERGESVVHVGSGTGYYSAILSLLVLPHGRVDAFEIRKDLAEQAARNLIPFENVTVHRADASSQNLPQADIIYVNASVTEPPLPWLKALRPGGRMIFPWQPSRDVGITALITSRGSGFAFEPLMQSSFIQCVGASDSFSDHPNLDDEAARNIRSVRVCAEQAPDDTSIAAFEHIWFSSEKLAA